MRRVFNIARSNAKRRGIAWSLGFDEWAAVWVASGKWAERGRKRGQYQMDRKDPAAGYHAGNVQIILGAVNRVKDSPHGWFAKLTEENVRAIRANFRPRIVTKPMLAALYGVSVGCIKQVLWHKTWRAVAMNRNLKSLLMILAALAAIALGCCVQVPEPPARKLSIEEDAAIADRCADGLRHRAQGDFRADG